MCDTVCMCVCDLTYTDSWSVPKKPQMVIFTLINASVSQAPVTTNSIMPHGICKIKVQVNLWTKIPVIFSLPLPR